MPAFAELPTPAELRALPDPAAAREVFKSLGVFVAEPPPPPDVAEMGWDIAHYTLAVRIDPTAQVVLGRATITATRNDTAGETGAASGDFVLDVSGPTIGAVRVNGVAVSATVADDALRLVGISGDSVEVQVEWTARGGQANGLQWGGNVVYSFHEPSGARTWLPVYDHPWDKATLDWIVTAPEGWAVAANGVLTETSAPEPGWTTWNYRFDQPIPTYLMTVHLADYTLTVGGTDIPLYTWTYGGREEQTARSLGDTEGMIRLFSILYAPYPWPSYGVALAPFGGAMENTTCVSFSDAIVDAGNGELVNVHELGHHWWGNDVTPATWDDIWLNEGFATYTEALWYEQAYGQEGLTSYAQWLSDSYYSWRELEGVGPLYNPAYMWGGTVYDKGGLVVHMLRGLLGDEAFFAALGDYEASYHMDVATTADLQASLESSTGQDLSWFFDQWVYGVGEPSYTWGWAAEPDDHGGWQLDVRVGSDRPEFSMPVPVRVTYADGTEEDLRVTVAGEEANASFCLGAEPVAVALDPDLWVLRAGEGIGAVTPGSPVCGQEVPIGDPPEGCGCGSPSPAGLGGALGSVAWLLGRRRVSRPVCR